MAGDADPNHDEDKGDDCPPPPSPLLPRGHETPVVDRSPENDMAWERFREEEWQGLGGVTRWGAE